MEFYCKFNYFVTKNEKVTIVTFSLKFFFFRINFSLIKYEEMGKATFLKTVVKFS